MLDCAHKKEIVRIDDDVEKTNANFINYALKNEVQEKFRKTEQEIWEELALKLERTNFENKVKELVDETEIEKKSVGKQLNQIREVTDRTRRKIEENTH